MCTEVKEEEKTSVQFKHVIYKVFKKKKKKTTREFLPGVELSIPVRDWGGQETSFCTLAWT